MKTHYEKDKYIARLQAAFIQSELDVPKLTHDELNSMILWGEVYLNSIREEKKTPPVNDTHYDRLQDALSLKSKLITMQIKQHK